MWSVCTFMTGAINSFALLFVFRILLGVFESAFNPCAYSMIADMFHPSQRTTASAIFNLGIYFGGALASLGAFLIKQIGWRSSYKLIGAIGVGFGACALIVPDPERGRFEKKKGNELSTMKVV
jgi:MFS family permease